MRFSSLKNGGIRRATDAATAQLQRRMRDRLKQMPWPLFTFADERVTDEEASSVGSQFLSMVPHRLRRGAARSIHAVFSVMPEATRVHSLVQTMRKVGKGTSIVPVTVAGVEARHALHKRRAAHSTQVQPLATIAAGSVAHVTKIELAKSVAATLGPRADGILVPIGDEDRPPPFSNG